MNAKPTFNIAVLPGDGIGPEVMQPCLDLIQLVAERTGGFNLVFNQIEAGAAHYVKTGVALPQEKLQEAGQADAILLGAMGLPEIRYDDGTEISPQIELREKLNLYAGVRPIKTLRGLKPVLSDPKAHNLDLVLIRESTEGLFAARDNGSSITDDQIARDTMIITRDVSEKLFDFGLKLAERRKEKGFAGMLTCVDKANVIGGFAFFRKIFDERASKFPGVTANHSYVDAMGLNLIKRPWEFDVLVTENMFGDILSDVGAALMGGMGMAPSADIGDDNAVFQPCHGSAPDIAGQGKANPTAMFLSAAMLLDWLGERHANADCVKAGELLSDAVEDIYIGGCLPFELGGTDGTNEISSAVMSAVELRCGKA